MLTADQREQIERRRQAALQRLAERQAAAPPGRKAAAGSSSNAVAAPSALASMLGRTGELTALFETLGVLSCALMACLSRGWRTAMNEARAQITSVDADGHDRFDWYSFSAGGDDKRAKYFCKNFVMSVLPRFYTGLRKLRLGYLDEAGTASRPSLEVDHRFPAVDEALAHVTSRLTQLRELDVDPAMSNVSLMIVASNCRNLQKLACTGSGISDAGLAALAQGCKQLEHLQIGFTTPWLHHALAEFTHGAPAEFTHEGVVAIARGCCLLKTLLLPNSPMVEDPALVALGKHCPLLRSLRGPGWNRITDAAVTALAHGCPQLEVVELKFAARLTDASASALAQGCPNLKTARLLGTVVTAAGVLTLAQRAKQKLTIDTDCMLDSAARALEEEYPVEVITHGVLLQGVIHFNEPVEGFVTSPSRRCVWTAMRRSLRWMRQRRCAGSCTRFPTGRAFPLSPTASYSTATASTRRRHQWSWTWRMATSWTSWLSRSVSSRGPPPPSLSPLPATRCCSMPRTRPRSRPPR